MEKKLMQKHKQRLLAEVWVNVACCISSYHLGHLRQRQFLSDYVTYGLPLPFELFTDHAPLEINRTFAIEFSSSKIRVWQGWIFLFYVVWTSCDQEDIAWGKTVRFYSVCFVSETEMQYLWLFLTSLLLWRNSAIVLQNNGRWQRVVFEFINVILH